MADAVLLKCAAPGQFDDIAQQLGKLGSSLGSVDALKQEVQAFQGIGVDACSISNPLATELQDKLRKYQQKAFGGASGRPGSSKKVTTRTWLVPGASASQFQIGSYAEKLDNQNLQTGFWKSLWTITNTSGAEAEVKGTMELHSYTHEEGNTQLQLSRTFEGVMVQPMKAEAIEEDPSLANGALYQIIEWEHDVLSILKGLHQLSADSLKKIRRVLPITKTKMNWEVEAQRGVKHLKKTAKR